MSAGEEVGEACCGICCICGFSALTNWCNLNAYGNRGGNRTRGCCGSCCNDSFNSDSLDKWDKDKAKLRTETQPGPSEPMKTSAEPDPLPQAVAPAAPAASDGK